MTSAIEVIALTQRLVQMDTVNPPGRELEGMELLESLLCAHGFTTKLHSFGPGRANLVAMLGDDPAQPGICLSGHIDTVPLGDAEWTQAPFGGEIVSGRLYGRGSSDMKAGVAALVAAACRASTQYAGKGRLSLIITGGEETGCEGARSLAAESELTNADLLMIAEPTANVPVIGHRGMAWFRAVLHGVTAHGSMPQLGVNAAYKAAELMLAMRDKKFELQHDLLGTLSVNVGQVHGGSSFNSVPDRVEVSIDIRTIPGVTHEDLHESIAKHITKKDDLETLFFLDPVLSDPENANAQLVCSVVSEVTSTAVQPRFAAYFTDAGVLKPALGNPTTFILGPGEPTLAHKVDEYCLTENILVAEKIYRRLLASWFSVSTARWQPDAG